MPRRSQAQAQETRRDLLRRAVNLASAHGLEGLSIGGLASAAGISKSGLFAHFGSKEELQLATVEAAAEVFRAQVPGSLAAPEAGLPRLAELAAAWLRYLESSPFRGGCFFAAASLEMDDRPGRVRDAVAARARQWQDLLEEAAAEAVDLGQLDPHPEGVASELAFEVHAFLQEANRAFQLHGDAAVFRQARRAIRRSLESRATPAGLAALESLRPR